jgi:hypothetical protein
MDRTRTKSAPLTFGLEHEWREKLRHYQNLNKLSSEWRKAAPFARPLARERSTELSLVFKFGDWSNLMVQCSKRRRHGQESPTHGDH